MLNPALARPSTRRLNAGQELEQIWQDDAIGELLQLPEYYRSNWPLFMHDVAATLLMGCGPMPSPRSSGVHDLLTPEAAVAGSCTIEECRVDSCQGNR